MVECRCIGLGARHAERRGRAAGRRWLRRLGRPGDAAHRELRVYG